MDAAVAHPIPDAALDADLAVLAQSGPIDLGDYIVGARMWRSVVERIVVAEGCWLWNGYTRNERGSVYHRGRNLYVPRIVVAAKVGPLAPGIGALHECDNPPCCRPSHLFPGTAKDNAEDMDRKGRRRIGVHHYGERHHATVLTDAQVEQLVAALAAPGARQRDVAAQFGVSQSTVWRILHRRTRTEGSVSK